MLAGCGATVHDRGYQFINRLLCSKIIGAPGICRALFGYRYAFARVSMDGDRGASLIASAPSHMLLALIDFLKREQRELA